jgi:hypothetical protein
MLEKMRLSQHFDANFYNKNVSILHIIKLSEEERERKISIIGRRFHNSGVSKQQYYIKKNCSLKSKSNNLGHLKHKIHFLYEIRKKKNHRQEETESVMMEKW